MLVEPWTGKKERPPARYYIYIWWVLRGPEEISASVDIE